MAVKFPSGVDLTNQRVINVADGVSDTDAVNRRQLDAARRNLDWKDNVRAATTANITLSGVQTIDGVSLAAGDRVLVKNQSTASQNGLYTVNSGAWVRTVDADENAEVTQGLAVSVVLGTANARTTYILTTADPITVGTTALTFGILGGGSAAVTAGNGINVSGSTISVQPATNGGITVDSAGVAIDASRVVQKVTGTLGDGTATSFTITHNLGSADVQVGVRLASTGERVFPDDVASSVNAVTLTFGTAPTAGQYRYSVQG